jgi:predicted DNA-binding transcriptional regulator AlpA
MFLRVKQVAGLTGLSKWSIYGAVARGELKALKKKGYKGRRGSILIPVAEYDAWIASGFESVDKCN